MRLRASCLSLVVGLLAYVSAFGADIRISGTTKVAPYTLVKLKVEYKDGDKWKDGLPPKTGFRWSVQAAKVENQPLIDWATDKGPKAKSPEWVAPPGMYLVTLKSLYLQPDGTPDWDEATTIVTIVPPTPDPTPVPPGPIPPGPTPPPGPGPQPPPSPDVEAPIKLPGLRVMVIYDILKKSDLTSGQREIIITSQEVTQYLRSKCVITPTNPDGAYRITDFRQGFAPDEEWGPALKRARTSLPWVIISNGKTGYEGPLPSDTTGKKFIELVKKYEVVQ